MLKEFSKIEINGVEFTKCLQKEIVFHIVSKVCNTLHEQVLDQYGQVLTIHPMAVIGNSRKHELVMARLIVIVIALHQGHMPFAIGAQLNRDRTVVYWAVKKYKELTESRYSLLIEYYNRIAAIYGLTQLPE